MVKKSTPPTTINCDSDMLATSAVSCSEEEGEEGDSSTRAAPNDPPKVTRIVCCAGDYCFIGEHIQETLSVIDIQLNIRCHKQCSDKEEKRHECDLCCYQNLKPCKRGEKKSSSC